MSEDASGALGRQEDKHVFCQSARTGMRPEFFSWGVQREMIRQPLLCQCRGWWNMGGVGWACWCSKYTLTLKPMWLLALF